MCEPLALPCASPTLRACTPNGKTLASNTTLHKSTTSRGLVRHTHTWYCTADSFILDCYTCSSTVCHQLCQHSIACKAQSAQILSTSQSPLSDLCRCIFPTPETGSTAAVASTTCALDSAADKRSASYSPVHRLHLASSSPAAGGHAAGSTPEELQSVSAVAADTHSDAELQPATAERWVAAGTAQPEATAGTGVEASGEAAAAALGLAGNPIIVRDGQQGAAWREQPVCSTAGSLEDSAFVGHGIGGSGSAGQDAAVAAAAGQQQGWLRVPWLRARGGNKASKVCKAPLWHHKCHYTKFCLTGFVMTGFWWHFACGWIQCLCTHCCCCMLTTWALLQAVDACECCTICSTMLCLSCRGIMYSWTMAICDKPIDSVSIANSRTCFWSTACRLCSHHCHCWCRYMLVTRQEVQQAGLMCYGAKMGSSRQALGINCMRAKRTGPALQAICRKPLLVSGACCMDKS